jgi:hypothetical protein
MTNSFIYNPIIVRKFRSDLDGLETDFTNFSITGQISSNQYLARDLSMEAGQQIGVVQTGKGWKRGHFEP